MTGETNHWVHLALTLFTCGLWIPIWIIAELSSSKRPMAVDVYGNPIVKGPQAAGPVVPKRPAWLDRHPWLNKLPGDPMLWIIMSTTVMLFLSFIVVALIVGATT